MTEADLQKLSSDLFRELTGKKKFKIQATFYNSSALTHNISKQNGTIHIKIAEGLKQAPEFIFRILLTILILKLYRHKVDRKLYRAYREYLEFHPELTKSRKPRQPSSKYQATGNFFDLEALFEQLNETYFANQLKKPILGWSLRKSYRRLGFYSKEKNLLVISRILDSKKVPPEVVKFLLYHEMLHMAIPVQKVNGRRQIHPSVFKQREKQFPNYQSIQKWLKKNLVKL